MTNDRAHANAEVSDRALTVYLRDHFAGSTAGLALVRRAARNNTDTELEDVLASLETEIEDDRRALLDIMSRLEITPSRFKSALGKLAEMVGRLKGNGRIVRRSPSTPVVELEGLAAGIVTKRNLWRSLRAGGPALGVLDSGSLDVLEQRATSQLETVVTAHERAATRAFGPS